MKPHHFTPEKKKQLSGTGSIAKRSQLEQSDGIYTSYAQTFHPTGQMGSTKSICGSDPDDGPNLEHGAEGALPQFC